MLNSFWYCTRLVAAHGNLPTKPSLPSSMFPSSLRSSFPLIWKLLDNYTPFNTLQYKGTCLRRDSPDFPDTKATFTFYASLTISCLLLSSARTHRTFCIRTWWHYTLLTPPTLFFKASLYSNIVQIPLRVILDLDNPFRVWMLTVLSTGRTERELHKENYRKLFRRETAFTGPHRRKLELSKWIIFFFFVVLWWQFSISMFNDIWASREVHAGIWRSEPSW